MSKKNGASRGLANPSRLKPLDPDDKQMLRVVIELLRGAETSSLSTLTSTFSNLRQCCHPEWHSRTTSDLFPLPKRTMAIP